MNRESDPLFGWVYRQKSDPTIQDVRRACAMIESVFGKDEVRILFERFGATHLWEGSYPRFSCVNLWIGSYRELILLAARCVEWKHPPSGGWTGDLPNHVVRLLE